MKLTEALQLSYGDTIEHKTLQNADGSAMRFKVNGKVKTWKRDKQRIAIPLKHGLYDYGYLTNGTVEGNGFIVELSEVKKAKW